MNDDFRNIFDAIKANNVRKIMAMVSNGQNLNIREHGVDVDGDSTNRCLLHAYIDKNKSDAFLKLLAFKKHLDLEACDEGGASPLVWAAYYSKLRGFPYYHFLIQAGVDLNYKNGSCDQNQTAFQAAVSSEDVCCQLALLSAGADPENVPVPVKVRAQVAAWLKGFQYAKKRLRDLFDQEMLEKLIGDFTYNEDFLWNVLTNTDS